MAANPKMTLHELASKYRPEFFAAQSVEREVLALHAIISLRWAPEHCVRKAIRDVLDAHWANYLLGGVGFDFIFHRWHWDLIRGISGETKEG